MSIREISETTDEIAVEIVRDNSHEDAELDLLKRSLESYGDRYLRIKHAFEAGIDTLEEYRDNKLRLQSEEQGY